MARRTKIVATLGPSTDGPGVLGRMIDAGVDVARLSFAHGSPERHLDRVARVHAEAETRRRPVGILVDLPGPKVRAAGFVDGAPVCLVEGQRVQVVACRDHSTAEVISVRYPTLLDDVHRGDCISIGDGAVGLLVEEVSSEALGAVVLRGGAVQGSPGVHLPSDRVSLSSPTAEDLRLLERCAGAGVDMVALSFVRRAADVDRLRAASPDGALVVAKIETAGAIEDLEGIVRAADGVMVARGDLGVELPVEEVPHLQKQIIQLCLQTGRPVITATQMLETMTTLPVPTRAEASDVANAVLDGTDALMLSGETAIGRDPVAVVRTMVEIAARADEAAEAGRWRSRSSDIERGDDLRQALAHAAWQAARDARCSAILCCTRTGATARAMARYRPAAELVALSPSPRTINQLCLSWGTRPLHLPEASSTDELVTAAVSAALDAGLVHPGEMVAVLSGASAAGDPTSFVMRLMRV
jgi:pyruvate kinase